MAKLPSCQRELERARHQMPDARKIPPGNFPQVFKPDFFLRFLERVMKEVPESAKRMPESARDRMRVPERARREQKSARMCHRVPEVAAECQREPGVKDESQVLQEWTLKIHGSEVSTLNLGGGNRQEEEIIVL